MAIRAASSRAYPSHSSVSWLESAQLTSYAEKITARRPPMVRPYRTGSPGRTTLRNPGRSGDFSNSRRETLDSSWPPNSLVNNG